MTGASLNIISTNIYRCVRNSASVDKLENRFKQVTKRLQYGGEGVPICRACLKIVSAFRRIAYTLNISLIYATCKLSMEISFKPVTNTLHCVGIRCHTVKGSQNFVFRAWRRMAYTLVIS